LVTFGINCKTRGRRKGKLELLGRDGRPFLCGWRHLANTIKNSAVSPAYEKRFANVIRPLFFASFLKKLGFGGSPKVRSVYESSIHATNIDNNFADQRWRASKIRVLNTSADDMVASSTSYRPRKWAKMSAFLYIHYIYGSGSGIGYRYRELYLHFHKFFNFVDDKALTFITIMTFR